MSAVAPDARADALARLLAETGFADAGIEALAGDASFRRYLRLVGGPVPALVMDAPPPNEDVRPWLRIARHLRGLGFSAPAVLGADEAAGLAVIEDFGANTFTRLLAGGADEAVLYDLAVDVLIALHGMGRERTAPGWLGAYGDALLCAEAALFTDWYMPAVTGRPTPAEARAQYLDLFAGAFEAARAVPVSLVLRDYHVDNLMRIDGRSGIEACGLLDFQDAVAGPVAYDVISLIEDARRDLGTGVAERALARYLAAFPDLDREAFAVASAALAAGRNAKIIGIFTRLAHRDAKPAYLAHIPRVWRLLERDLAHPALGELAGWFARAVPPGARMVPAAEPRT